MRLAGKVAAVFGLLATSLAPTLSPTADAEPPTKGAKQVPPAAQTGSAPTCPFLAADAKPMVVIAETRQRAAYAAYPLGFSKKGRFAWLETSQGFDDDRRTWILHVVNLDNDRDLVAWQFFVRRAGISPMCAIASKAIMRLLDKHQIEIGAPPTVAPADDPKAPPTVEVISGRRDPESSKTSYRVLLRGPEGWKQVGLLWRVEAESGETPRAKPVIVGLLRSPFEPRVAAVASQKVLGIEATEITELTVMGGRLDRGWRKEPP